MEEEEEGEDDEKERKICLWHQFGHCKFGPKCLYRHVAEVCRTEGSQGVCRLRHPPACKLFLAFGRCKFGSGCSFQHLEKQTYVPEIDSSDQKIKVLEDRIKELEAKLIFIEEGTCIDNNLEQNKGDWSRKYDDVVLETGEANTTFGGGKSDEKLDLGLIECEKVIAHTTNKICVPSTINQMSMEQVLGSLLENKSFKDFVEKEVSVRTNKLEETLNKLRKQTERWCDDTRDCVIDIDDYLTKVSLDVTTLWDKVIGNEDPNSETVKEVGPIGEMEKEEGGQTVHSNDELVIAPTNKVISIPIYQTEQHMDISSSNSLAKRGKGKNKGGKVRGTDRRETESLREE